MLTYLKAEGQRLQSQRIQSLLEYWKQHLSGDLPVVNLSTDC